MSSAELSLAGSSLRVHLQQLRWCGFCRLSPREPASWRRALHDVYRALTLTVTTAYLLQECIYAYQERNDLDKIARVMFLLLGNVASLAKQIVFFVDADRIDRMIADMNDPLYNQSDAQHRAQLVETARGAGRFTRAFATATATVCLLWTIFPIMCYARGQPVELPFWVPFDYSGPVEFALTMWYSYYVTTVIGIADISMDAFIATVLRQCRTQLRILRKNFENLPSNAKQISRTGTTNETFEQVLNRTFLDCMTHYRKISEMTHQLQDIFGPAILAQFGSSGWIICMAAYKIVSLNILSTEFASMNLFICVVLTELFLYCYYGNEVTVESDRVVESLYAMQWLETPARFRRSLIVVMERAKRPLRPVAGRVIPLSLDTFVKIVKSSYSFYTVLRQNK